MKKQYFVPNCEIVECAGSQALCVGSTEINNGSQQNTQNDMGDSVW